MLHKTTHQSSDSLPFYDAVLDHHSVSDASENSTGKKRSQSEDYFLKQSYGSDGSDNPFAFAPYSDYLSELYQSPLYADDLGYESSQESPLIKMRYAIRKLIKPISDRKPIVPPVSTHVSKKRKRATSEHGVKRRKRTKGSSAGDQPDCCIKGCSNTVTNRLRFSLRCKKAEDYKEEYLLKDYNKVCVYHYFSDLYAYKRQNGRGGVKS